MNRRRRYDDRPVDPQTADLMNKASAKPLARVTRWDLAFGCVVLFGITLDSCSGKKPDVELRDRSVFIEGYDAGRADAVDSVDDAPTAWDNSLAHERSQEGN